MTPTFSLLGITWHWYGLIVGLAVVGVLQLMEKKATETRFVPQEISNESFWQILMVSILGAIFGARAWHLVTDWPVYAQSLASKDWAPLFRIWNGGLSILGAILGGVLGSVAAIWWKEKNLRKVGVFLDLAALSFPFGQAIGRFANYVNQELYGLPSNLPWSIFISPENRLEAFAHVSKYHPLFFYEVIALLIFGVFLWYHHAKTQQSLGSGKYFFWYVGYYALIRFFLDFLRLGLKPVWMGMGINQIILLSILLVMGSILLRKNSKTK